MSKKELVFDVAFGKYEEGVTVVFYDGPKGDNEKFTINKDDMITCLQRLHKVPFPKFSIHEKIENMRQQSHILALTEP